MKNTRMIASIADNCFEGFAAMLLTDRLGEATYVDQWWEDDVKHGVDVCTESFCDFLKSLACFIGQLSALRFGATHEGINDVANAYGEPSGLLLGGVASAEGWDNVAACLMSLGPVVLGFFALEGDFEVLQSGLHDVVNGWFWSVEKKEVVKSDAEEDNQQFLIVDVGCPKDSGDRKNERLGSRT